MTLTKRKLNHAAVYMHPEFLERSSLDASSSHPSSSSSSQLASHLKDVNMTAMTGVLSQIGHLAAYATELLDGLFRIAQETSGRLETVGDRVVKLHASLLLVEGLPPPPLLIDAAAGHSAFAQKLEIKVPHIFTKQTGDDAVLGQYYLCTPPPALRKFDALLGGEQCMQSYSHPRFFFEQWFKSELKRQEAKKAEKKKKKNDRREKRDKTKTQEQKSAQKKKAVKRVTMQSWKQQLAGATEPNGVPMPSPESIQNVPPPPPQPPVKLMPKSVPPPPPPPNAFKKRGSAPDYAMQSSTTAGGPTLPINVVIVPPPPTTDSKRSSVRNLALQPPSTTTTTTTQGQESFGEGESGEEREGAAPQRGRTKTDRAKTVVERARVKTGFAESGNETFGETRVEGGDGAAPLGGTEAGVGAEQDDIADGARREEGDGGDEDDEGGGGGEDGAQERKLTLSARMQRPLSTRMQSTSRVGSARFSTGSIARQSSMSRGGGGMSGELLDGDEREGSEGGDGGAGVEGRGTLGGGSSEGFVDENGERYRADTSPYRESRYRSSGDEMLLQEDEEQPVDPLSDPMLDKYKTMQKINLPEGAIRQKMERDGIDPDLVDLMCPNTAYDRPKAGVKAKAASIESLPEEDDPDAPQGDPAEWEEAKEQGGGGRIYYVKKSTWESSWVAPVGWKAYQTAQKEAAAAKAAQTPKLGGSLQDAILKGRNLRRLSVTPGAAKFVDERVEVLDVIKSGNVKLKKAAPLPPKRVDARQDIMSAIKQGTLKNKLQHVEVNKFDATERMDAAVAQLLANRTAIAGGDSDSDSDSDSDYFSDDDYP